MQEKTMRSQRRFFFGLSFLSIICYTIKNTESQVVTIKPTNTQCPEQSRQKRWLSAALKILGKSLLVLLETVVLLVSMLYGVMFILAKGPSPTARDLFVISVRETSAVGFLANLFFTPEEIAAIEANGEEEEYADTDTSLIVIPSDPSGNQSETGAGADEWGLMDEDGDGIIIDKVSGEGYSGYMMVVLDPSRVIMGSQPEQFGVRGFTVAEMAEHFGAVAAINAGGFVDINGNGHGETPDALVVYEGQIYYEGSGIQGGFVGFDKDHILHVGNLHPGAIRERNIRYGVAFGPVLVSNGDIVKQSNSGVNPRTAIGQRSDGAILMLVIDGRQLVSLGATYTDLAEIMIDYGAVNACNLDGGSSSLMYYNGAYINNCASVIGIRPVPTTFLVLPKEDANNG